MYAYAEKEETKEEQVVQEIDITHQPLVEREFSAEFRESFIKLLARLTVKKTDSNTFS